MCENMKEVSSSNIKSIGYNEDTQILCVRFLDGSLYIYKGVPSSKFEGLSSASSVGRFLNQNIKGVYPYEQIE